MTKIVRFRQLLLWQKRAVNTSFIKLIVTLSRIGLSIFGTKKVSNPLRCLLSTGCEILEQTSGTSSFVTLSIYLQKAVGPSMVRNLPYSTCVTSVPIH